MDEKANSLEKYEELLKNYEMENNVKNVKAIPNYTCKLTVTLHQGKRKAQGVGLELYVNDNRIGDLVVTAGNAPITNVNVWNLNEHLINGDNRIVVKGAVVTIDTDPWWTAKLKITYNGNNNHTDKTFIANSNDVQIGSGPLPVYIKEINDTSIIKWFK